MPNVSIFKNFNKVTENKPIESILSDIKTGKWKTDIEKLRNLKKQNKVEQFDSLKKSLPAFTPSGQFENGRKPEFLKEYSKLIVIDIDKLPEKKLQTVKTKASECKYTFACFVSPGGNGLKILVKVDSDKDQHLLAFNCLKKYFDKQLDIDIDKSGKDITRLCFVSFDSGLFYNPESKPFSVQPQQAAAPDPWKIFEDAIAFTEKKESFIEGNRNNFIHLLACNLNRKGISEIEAQTMILSAYNYNETEVKKTIRSAYSNLADHGQARTSAVSPKSEAKRNDIPLKSPRPISSNKFLLAIDFIKEHFEIRRNMVSQEYECRAIDQEEFETMNEFNVFVKMQTSGLNISLNNLVALLKSDIIPAYNPFTLYFDNLPKWDQQTDHIKHLASFIKVKDRERFDRHFKKWLVRAVKCALVDSYFNKQAFILVHDKQNSGKSTFCRFLCPPALSDYIAENLSIDKDSRILLTRNLLINLDELSTLSKVEINSLKSMFSKDKINERLPYDRRNTITPRRCSFIGSTNQVEFLNDETGSVRWLCFVIDEIDWSYSEKVNIDLIYAQAYHLFKSGFDADLTPEEIRENEEFNKEFQVLTTERELINKFLLPGTKDHHDHFWTATDILLYLANVTENKVKLHSSNLGKALKMNHYEREKKHPDKIYGYYVICK